MSDRVHNVAIFFIAGLLVAAILGCTSGSILIRPVTDQQSLVEQILPGSDKAMFADKIVVIDVDGIITNKRRGGFMSSGENPTSLFLEKLDKAKHDKRVKAVVLRLNTPGGTVAASDSMYRALKEFKDKTQKPVVASMLDLTASGGYYLACGCDQILAQPSTITGSIGTIVQTVNFKGTMDLLGISSEAIKSGKLKDMASPLRKLNDEDREVLQGIIDRFYGQFLDVVLAGRPNLTAESLKPLADGRVYTADQALQAGLIDQIGYPDDAIQKAKEIAGVNKARIIIYQRPFDYKANIYATDFQASSTPALVNIEIPQWLQTQGPQFLYLWQGFDLD